MKYEIYKFSSDCDFPSDWEFFLVNRALVQPSLSALSKCTRHSEVISHINSISPAHNVIKGTAVEVAHLLPFTSDDMLIEGRLESIHCLEYSTELKKLRADTEFRGLIEIEQQGDDCLAVIISIPVADADEVVKYDCILYALDSAGEWKVRRKKNRQVITEALKWALDTNLNGY